MLAFDENSVRLRRHFASDKKALSFVRVVRLERWAGHVGGDAASRCLHGEGLPRKLSRPAWSSCAPMRLPMHTYT